jgi:hypothetical protein
MAHALYMGRLVLALIEFEWYHAAMLAKNYGDTRAYALVDIPNEANVNVSVRRPKAKRQDSAR